MKKNPSIKNEYIQEEPSPYKKNPFKKDVLYTPEGQWKYPGQVTKIPSGNITMHSVSYPVLGVDNLGNSQIMYPDIDYQFSGEYVIEYPILNHKTNSRNDYPFGGQNTKTHTHMKKGGWLDELNDDYKKGGSTNPLMLSRSKRNKTSKNIQSSVNKIFLRNYDIFGPGGKNVYDPKSKYKNGGSWLDNLT